MKGRPLWQLAKQTLTPQENLLQFTYFLKSQRRQLHHGHSINFEAMFMRVAVLLMFCLAEGMAQHWVLLAYFCFKVWMLFEVRFEKQQSLQVLGMLAAFYLLDYFTKLIPFMNLLYWYVNVSYFLFGIQEKYLSLNLMMLPIPWLNKSLVVTLLGLGRVKQAVWQARPLAYLDVFILFATARVRWAISLGCLLLLVELVKIMDQRMIYTKKNYTHLDEIPLIEQYH